MMTAGRLVLGLMLLLGLAAAGAEGHGRTSWSIGVGVGAPPPVYHRPCWHGADYFHYRPRPVYVVPPPVYLAPAPVIIQPAPVIQPVGAYQAPAPTPVSPYAPVADPRQADMDRYLGQLGNPDERVRFDSVTQLGRLRSPRAIDPLAASLSGDASPAVRDAAARALGLIAAPGSLPALQQAAQVDPDGNVRRSAQYSIEIIQGR